MFTQGCIVCQAQTLKITIWVSKPSLYTKSGHAKLKLLGPAQTSKHVYNDISPYPAWHFSHPGENVQKTPGPICFSRPATLWIFFAETASWQKVVWKSVCHTQHHPIQTSFTINLGAELIDTWCHKYQKSMLYAKINGTWVFSDFYNSWSSMIINVALMYCWWST